MSIIHTATLRRGAAVRYPQLNCTLTARVLHARPDRLAYIGRGEGGVGAMTSKDTSLVGREEELSRLRELVAPPYERSRVLLLLGDPGMGKTVLLAEAARAARLGGDAGPGGGRPGVGAGPGVRRAASAAAPGAGPRGRPAGPAGRRAARCFRDLRGSRAARRAADRDRRAHPAFRAVGRRAAAGGRSTMRSGWTVPRSTRSPSPPAAWNQNGSCCCPARAGTRRRAASSGTSRELLLQPLSLPGRRPAAGRAAAPAARPGPRAGARPRRPGNPLALIELSKMIAADPDAGRRWAAEPLPLTDQLTAIMAAQYADLPRVSASRAAARRGRRQPGPDGRGRARPVRRRAGPGGERRA